MSRTRVRVAGAWVDLASAGPVGPPGDPGDPGTPGSSGLGVLAVAQVNPVSSGIMYSLPGSASGGVFGPVDTTNLALPIPAIPPSGKILCRVSALMALGSGSPNPTYLSWCTPEDLTHPIQNVYHATMHNTFGPNGMIRCCAEALFTGFTPGTSKTIYLAWSPSNSTTGATNIYAGQGGYGPITISAHAAP